MPNKQSDSATILKGYENNPFLVSLNGINHVFEKAKGVGILLIVIGVISAIGGLIPDSSDKHPMQGTMASASAQDWLVLVAIIVVILTAVVFISAMISGICAYTAARIARGKEVTLPEAFHAVLDRFFSYIWLQIIILVKVVLWSLLLIVPGVIMSVRYSLASVVFFDQELNGDAAIKESMRLTEGAWLTTFASLSLFNVVTFSVISDLVDSGSKMVLYRQFIALKKDAVKPPAHVLSWLTLLLPLGLILLVIMLAIMFVGFVAVFGLLNR